MTETGKQGQSQPQNGGADIRYIGTGGIKAMQGIQTVPVVDRP